SNERGEVPNIGANDGAMFETLHSLNYRDYRPALQLFYGLLNNVRLWDDSKLDEPLFWRNLTFDNRLNHSLINSVRDNEFIQLIDGNLIVRIKATQNNFRPANDVLNIDVWYRGENLIMDTGSYSYNAKESNFFKSIEA